MSIVAISTLFIAIAITSTSWNNKELYSISLLSIEAIAQSESGDNCKWKLIDCPGLWTGDYEACLTNGDGNSCSCGSVSRECPTD